MLTNEKPSRACWRGKEGGGGEVWGEVGEEEHGLTHTHCVERREVGTVRVVEESFGDQVLHVFDGHRRCVRPDSQDNVPRIGRDGEAHTCGHWTLATAPDLISHPKTGTKY